jgi:hypothetical protein
MDLFRDGETMAGVMGAIAIIIAAVFAFSRSVPFDRLRLRADLEILHRVRRLNLDDRALTDYLQKRLRKYPPGLQVFEKQFNADSLRQNTRAANPEERIVD